MQGVTQTVLDRHCLFLERQAVGNPARMSGHIRPRADVGNAIHESLNVAASVIYALESLGDEVRMNPSLWPNQLQKDLSKKLHVQFEPQLSKIGDFTDVPQQFERLFGSQKSSHIWTKNQL